MTDTREAKGPVILLVEDEILIRMIMADDLRLAGFQVLEAIDGEEALVLFRANSDIRLVVSDIRVPGSIDGVQLTARIKQQCPQMPVVLVSSHLPEGEEVAADRFVRKPYNQAKLIEIVQELTGAEWAATLKRDAS
jgi:CheY-like chemotaxis protein